MGLMHRSLFQTPFVTTLWRYLYRLSLGSRVSEPFLQLLVTAGWHLEVGNVSHLGFLPVGARLRAALSPLPAQPVSLARQELWVGSTHRP